MKSYEIQNDDDKIKNLNYKKKLKSRNQKHNYAIKSHGYMIK